MSINTYNYPIVYTPQDNASATNTRLIRTRFCAEDVPEEFANLWNYNLCSQDKCYCQPFVKGDYIPVQYQIKDPAIKSITAALKRFDDDTVFWGTEGFLQEQVGNDEFQNRFYNLLIDTSKFDEKCFYVAIVLIYQDIDFEDFSDCVETKMLDPSVTLIQATYECKLELSAEENQKTVASEPWCQTRCEDTVVITGEYPGHDCNGNYYGLIDVTNVNLFTPWLRVRGEVAQQNFGFTKTTINNKVSGSVQIRNYLFRTAEKVPPYVVEGLAVCFNSKKLMLDGAEFTRGAELSKNNEEGNMWIISSTVSKECDEVNFTCL